ALLKLEDVRLRTPTGPNAAAQAGYPLYQEHCQVCHGATLQGVGAAPSLLGVTSRLADDAIRAVITGGRGLMRPVDLSGTDLTAVIAFLRAAEAMAGGRGAGPAPALPPGPVVASGGVPLPAQPARGRGPVY